MRLAMPLARLWRDGVRGERKAGVRPCRHAAVEHAHVRMAQVFEQPEATSGAQAGLPFVDHHGPVRRHSAQREEVPDHPHEGAQWCLAGIDETDTPEVEMNAAGQVADSEFFGGTKIEQQRRLRGLQLLLQLARRDEHGYWITTKRHRRATSLAFTYLPISFSNCSFVFQGRYSLNSCSICLPTPGMLRMIS